MASSGSCSAPLALIFFLSFAAFVSNLEGRKILQLNDAEQESKMAARNGFSSLFLSALPKGRVPASSPTKKTHSAPEKEELSRRHLRKVDRNLQSVPSPGVGH